MDPGDVVTYRFSIIFLCRCDPAVKATPRNRADKKFIGWI
jgi:hypothetical protein